MLDTPAPLDVDPLRPHVDAVPEIGTWVTIVDLDGDEGVVPTLLPARRRSTPSGPSISLDERAFRTAVRTMLGDIPIDLVAEHVPVDAERRAFWRAIAAHLRWSAGEGTGLADVQLVRRATFDLVVAAVLVVFPVAGEDIDRADDLTLPASLRRAIRHIEEHVHDGTPVEDIAAAAGLSVRGLQAAFRRHLDRTPLEHLRLLRLHAAHDELIAADPTDGTTIEAVARRWGFSSSGRFAAAYRREYGMLPSVTLRH